MKVKTIIRRLSEHGIAEHYCHDSIRSLTNQQRKEFVVVSGISMPGKPRRSHTNLKQVQLLDWLHRKIKTADLNERLRLLRWAAEQSGKYKVTTTWYTRQRSRWEIKKHKKVHQRKKCLVCQNGAEIRHHVFQIQNGGYNLPNNIVGLCRPCHGKIHPWLSHSHLS